MSDPSEKQVNAPVKQVVQPCPKPTIDLQYLDCKGNGIAGAKYQLYSVDVNREKDGFYEKSGTLDGKGCAHIDNVPELVGFVYYFEKDPKPYKPEEQPSKKPDVAKAQSVLDSIGDWLLGAAQGDFNKEQTTGQLVVNTLLGLVPIVDQVLDARDIVSGLKDIVEYYMEDDATQKKHPDELGLDYELWMWINVFIIAIGCIPIVGSAVKGVLKGVLHYLKSVGKVATKLSPKQLRVGWEYLVAILNKFGVGNAHQWLKTEFPSKIDSWMKQASSIIKRGLDSIMETADKAVKGVKVFSTEKAALVAKRVEDYKKAINKAKSKVDEMAAKVKQWFKEQINAITGGAHKSESLGATGTKSQPVNNQRTQLQAEAPDLRIIRSRVATKPNTAFFWSGRSNGIGGQKIAQQIAESRGGTTLEGLIAKNHIDMPDFNKNDPTSVQAWKDISSEFAEGVSGDVSAVVGKDLLPGNIWENVELPALKQNPNVTRITVIDPETGVETIIFNR
jgi:hypothetical protein